MKAPTAEVVNEARLNTRRFVGCCEKAAEAGASPEMRVWRIIGAGLWGTVPTISGKRFGTSMLWPGLRMPGYLSPIVGGRPRSATADTGLGPFKMGAVLFRQGVLISAVLFNRRGEVAACAGTELMLAFSSRASCPEHLMLDLLDTQELQHLSWTPTPGGLELARAVLPRWVSSSFHWTDAEFY